jgi:hypothetical protein
LLCALAADDARQADDGTVDVIGAQMAELLVIAAGGLIEDETEMKALPSTKQSSAPEIPQHKDGRPTPRGGKKLAAKHAFT